MTTEKEIKEKYKTLHDTLTSSYYSGKSRLSKEDFDIQHGKVWADMEAELIAGGYLKPPELARNLEVEIDELKAKIALLGKK